MSNAKCHTRPYVAVRVVATARPAAWQRGSAAALEINKNEGQSTPRSARPSGLRSVPGMQRVWPGRYRGHASDLFDRCPFRPECVWSDFPTPTRCSNGQEFTLNNLVPAECGTH